MIQAHYTTRNIKKELRAADITYHTVITFLEAEAGKLTSMQCEVSRQADWWYPRSRERAQLWKNAVCHEVYKLYREDGMKTDVTGIRIVKRGLWKVPLWKFRVSLEKV